MTKIFIVGVQDWTTKDRETGEEISGKSYIGFLKSGVAIKFTSREQYTVYTGEVEFDVTRAQDVNLLTKFFNGKVSYQDGASFGKEDVASA